MRLEMYLLFVCAASRAAETRWNFLFFFCFLAASDHTGSVRRMAGPSESTAIILIQPQRAVLGTASKINHI